MSFVAPTHLPNYADHREIFSSIGVAGFSLLLNFTRQGPEYLDSTYPLAWQEEYDTGHYYFKDPVLIWSLARTGDRRWSAVGLPDLARVMVRAKLHNLNYGAAFVRTSGKSRSLLSVARSDRELSDAEMGKVSESFTALVQEAGNDKTLTAKELDALQCLANDMTLDAAARHLGVSTAAVKARLSAARQRLGAETNYHAVAVALRSKLIR
jgi:LuxR family transcriptional regulator, quorum-sensing system regulator SdiA